MADPTLPGLPAVRNQLAAQPDLLRELVEQTVNALLSADADAVCGAEYGERSPDRSTGVTGTASGAGTPAPAPSTCRSPSCAKARTSRTGCWSAGAGRRRP